MLIREIEENDLESLLELYLKHLGKNKLDKIPEKDRSLSLMREILADKDYHLLGIENDGKVVSSVTVVIIKNLTHDLRPYALVENVVTHAAYRNQGYATMLMDKVSEIAKERGCYKIMLLTGSKQESTLRFYERCGFNRDEKTGFIKRF